MRGLVITGLVAAAAAAASGAIGNAWHVPEGTHVPGAATMRAPLSEIGPATAVTIHSGSQFQGAGNPGNQTGGWLVWRARGGTWQSTSLVFHAESGNDKFWRAVLDTSAFGPADVLEYYLKITYSDRDDTFVHGGDGASLATASEAVAQAAPFSIRDRPAWVFHGGNRTTSGSNVTFWVKAGYTRSNDLATAWANRGAVYFTTDGSAPGGALGVPAGTALAVPLAFDHPANDPSVAGNAAWFRGTASNLPPFTTIRYRIGLWHTNNLEEKQADHLAGGAREFQFSLGMLGEPVLTVATDAGGTLNANYTTTKVFVDEIAGTTVPLRIRFAPGESNVVAAEVFSNLNRRDRAALDADGDGWADGIAPPDGDAISTNDAGHYYRAYAMAPAATPGEYELALDAERTGAYRLTARWKVAGDPAWRWYTNPGANRRDHAVTVSPAAARDIVLYEINALTVEASGDTVETRSTLEDLHNAPGAPHNGDNRWDLDTLVALGANWLWFQPIHPPARDGREPYGGWGSGNPPYEPGSPYAVKNFFEVSPLLTKNFAGTYFNDADLASPANRAAAMTAWSNFVAAADGRGVGIMLDAPFNHTAFDVELADAGVELLQPDGAAWAASDEIRAREARFFSKAGAYGDRASSAGDIAAAPDRYDFGKWNDVKDVFFGRYDALVETDVEPERSSHVSEGDGFDSADSDWTAADFTQGGQPRNVTRRVWEYFARYAVHWLARTRSGGANRNSTPADGDAAARRAWDARGIDGLRCDFGQGLPPQAWEYIINVARSHKWSFVMMSESLDGGAVTYRSNRHFDILNENIVFPFKNAATKDDYRAIFEQRRDVYGQGLVLLNSTSHDEENYADPWEALIRFSVAATVDGAPLIFPGQELGASTTNGYSHYELNFGKRIPHFKRFNSMKPAWDDANFGLDQLFPVYAGLAAARGFSPALRSPNRWFLDGDGANAKIHGVAKYGTAGASPAFGDVVLAFANLDRNADSTDNFRIPGALAPLLGIKDDRTYNVRNIAAYLNGSIGMTGRRDAWLWGSGIPGAALKSAGFLVSLRRVPTMDTSANPSDPAWNQRPFEGQYLKLYDVTPPPQAGAPAAPKAYAIGTNAVFAWTAGATGADDCVTGYVLEVGTTPGGSDVFSGASGAAGTATVAGAAGQTLYATVRSVSAAGVTGAASAASAPVALLAPDGDQDHDGATNADEDLAGTDPLSAGSVFRALAVGSAAASGVGITVATESGRTYRIEFTDGPLAPSPAWAAFGSAANGVGSWLESRPGPTNFTFVDDRTEATTTNAPAGSRFYRVRAGPNE